MYFGLSKLWYLLNFISLEEKEIQEFETIMFKYLWEKSELISRKVLGSEFKHGGLNMINIRAKIDMINTRNMFYIKINMHRPQYQFSIFWMKSHFREYITNYNITPIGMDIDRPKIYQQMIESFKKYSFNFKKWCEIENESRKKRIEKGRKKIYLFDVKPFNNLNFSSKFIYNLFNEDFIKIKKISSAIDNNEQERIYSKIHKLNSSKVRLTNYKLLHDGLPTNKKFRHRYDYKCYVCKKKLSEDLEHIFVKCEKSKIFYTYIKEYFLSNKAMENSLDLLRYKRKVAEEDYRVLSCFVYVVWRVRNACKHGEVGDDPCVFFNILFNKWLISLTGT